MENVTSDDIERNTLTKLGAERLTLLRVRKRQKKKKPRFARQESWRYKRVATSWRRPRGIDSAMRLKRKSRPKLVEIGYRSPRKVRGLHPSGFEEKLVCNVKDLQKVNLNQVVRISRTVGLRKRLMIVENAQKLGLRVLNTRGVDVGESTEPKNVSV